MFSAVLDNVGLLRDSVATISELIDEGEIKVRKDGIELLANDRAVVAVVDFRFSSKNFEQYNYESDKSIGINISGLLQVLKRAKAGEKMTIKLDENSLRVHLENSSVRRFRLPLIEIRDDVPSGIEKLNFKTHFEITSESLSDSIDDADLVSDSIVFEVAKNRVVFKANNDSSAIETDFGSGNDVKINTEHDARSRYSLDYLKKIVKAKKIADRAIVSFDSNYPMKVVFNKPDKVNLSFIVAPRIEE